MANPLIHRMIAGQKTVLLKINTGGLDPRRRDFSGRKNSGIQWSLGEQGGGN